MDQASPAKALPLLPMKTLEGQLREMYGRAAYTHKTHEKMADGYVRLYKRIKVAEICLSVLASSSLVLAIFGDSKPATIIGAIFSALVLGLTLYFREASLGEQAQKHTEVASKLWGVREALLSLLVDMHDGQAAEEIRRERDRLNDALESIYKDAPRTSASAYRAAQKALTTAQELCFSDAELDRMLPKRLRRDV
jgi:hypothetical protein